MDGSLHTTIHVATDALPLYCWSREPHRLPLPVLVTCASALGHVDISIGVPSSSSNVDTHIASLVDEREVVTLPQSVAYVELLVLVLVAAVQHQVSASSTVEVLRIQAQVLLLIDDLAILVEVPHLVHVCIAGGQDDVAPGSAIGASDIEAEVLSSVHDSARFEYFTSVFEPKVLVVVVIAMVRANIS